MTVIVVMTGDKKLYLPARNYSVAYQVKDTKGHINKGTLAVNAVNGVKVSGRVLAADGTGIDNVSVVASHQKDSSLLGAAALLE